MKDIVSRRKEILQSIGLYIRPFKWQFGVLIIIKVLLLVIGSATPLIFKYFIDDVVIAKKINGLIWVCSGFVLLFLIESAVLSYQKVLSNKVYNKVVFSIRKRLWKFFVDSPHWVYEKYSNGDLKSRIDTDTDTIENFLDRYVFEYSYFWGNIVLNTILFFVISWKLALFACLMVPISFWLTQRFGKGSKKTASNLRKIKGDYENWLQGTFNGWKEIKALSVSKNVSRIFTRYWHEIIKAQLILIMFIYGNKALLLFKDSFLTRMNLYFIGALFIVNGDLTIGSLLIFMKYYEQFFEAMGNISAIDIELSNAQPMIKKVTDILEMSKSLNKINRSEKKLHTGSVKFGNVSFKYNDAQDNVIKNINLEIHPFERIAIVGRSGCGKSTIIKLLTVLYPVRDGVITIGNKNIDSIDPITFHKNVGVVMQDSILFNLTIKENLTLAGNSISDNDIDEACRKAHIYDFIQSLPERYNTVTGEKGVKLSGGQRQRIAIARMLIADPAIMIFDESTSALDNDSEKAINQAIDEIAREKTVIIIAHRFSSVRNADRIVVMDNGEIISTGNHNELTNTCEIYNLLFSKQYEGLEKTQV